MFDDIFGWVFGGLALLLGAAAIITVGVLTYEAIKDWIKKARLRRLNAKYAELIKELINGDQCVHIKLSDHTGTDENRWKYEKLDPELQQKFSGRNKVLIPIEEVS